MFNAIKSTVLLCLLVGVIFFGFKIYEKSSELDSNLTEKKTEIIKRISKLKAKANDKKEIMEKVLRKINKSLKKDRTDQAKPQAKPQKINVQEKDDSSSKNATVASNTRISLNPMDEEDRRLTAKVLGVTCEGKNTKEVAANKTDKGNLYFISGVVIPERKPAEPLDLERVEKIRKIYSNTIEILEWK